MVEYTRRVIEVVITGCTRNAFALSGHVGSNPTPSAKKPVCKRFFATCRLLFCPQGVLMQLRFFLSMMLMICMRGNAPFSLYYRQCATHSSKHCLCRIKFGCVIQVSINICRCAEITVSKPLLYLFHRNSVLQEH